MLLWWSFQVLLFQRQRSCSKNQEQAIVRRSYTVRVWPFISRLRRVSNTPLAPAEDALAYRLDKFESGIYGGETEYQGPPNEYNNHLWKKLYSRTYNLAIEKGGQIPNHLLTSVKQI